MRIEVKKFGEMAFSWTHDELCELHEQNTVELDPRTGCLSAAYFYEKAFVISAAIDERFVRTMAVTDATADGGLTIHVYAMPDCYH